MNGHSTTALSDIAPSKYNISDESISKANDECINLLGAEAIISSLDGRRAHSITQWSPAAPAQIPAIVVFPTSTAEVSAIMKICSQRRIPVTAYCGGTSMPGALAATRGGICIDFNRMNKILAVHQEDMDVVVQPAVGWEDLNVRLGEHNLFFPPDPAPGAKIGGMVNFW
jgi:D-lactate dehydrogenase (cytochrome)